MSNGLCGTHEYLNPHGLGGLMLEVHAPVTVTPALIVRHPNMWMGVSRHQGSDWGAVHEDCKYAGVYEEDPISETGVLALPHARGSSH